MHLLIPIQLYDTQHIIVLMEENRSFDHFFGFAKKLKVDGLSGNEYNLINLSVDPPPPPPLHSSPPPWSGNPLIESAVGQYLPESIHHAHHCMHVRAVTVRARSSMLVVGPQRQTQRSHLSAISLDHRIASFHRHTGVTRGLSFSWT